MKPKMFIGFTEQPGIVDIQYMAQNLSRKGSSGIVVYEKTPAENVTSMAKEKGVPLLQADDVKAKVKELESLYKSDGFNVKIRDLSEVRNLMRDVC